MTSAEVCFAGSCLAVTCLPALSAAFDKFESWRRPAGTTAAMSGSSEGCLLPSWWEGTGSEAVGELVPDLEDVCELEPGIMLDICLSLLLTGTFSVSSTCKQWGGCNLHAVTKAKASIITGAAVTH